MKTIPLSLNLAYYALLLLTFLAVVLVFRKPIANSSSKRKYLPLIFLAVLWVVLTVLATQGFFLETIKNTPAGFIPAVLSVNILFVSLALFYKPTQEIHTSNMKWVVAIQTFRLPLELIFAWALALNLLPIQMTFEGRNFDILVGLTAPFIAYFGYHKKVLPKWSLILWNFAGLGLLFNIVTIAILSAPTNFQVFTNEPHNTIVLQPPYHFIPFFFVPLALFGHLFALKRLFGK
jgi:hypothetical protein